VGPGNPVAEFGQVVLLLTLVATSYAGAVSAVGARQGSRRLVNSGLYATYGVAALLTLASAIIFYSILSNDYSIKYVQMHSDASMPWYYKLTSYWGGLDGSMMFWGWLLSLFAAVAVFVNRERHRELIPWVNAILMAVLAFFLVLLIFEKRPFDVFLTEAPTAGKGLNPLLQDPYMAIHPPSLYIGLVSCAVPFAFGMAALITGNLDDSWLRSVRRWVLISWFFLSFGLILGMLWAYHVLGWGGYWGWDPVENAGSLAWFTCTAFLHSVIVQERRGMLKVWNLFLVITGFVLTMIATFLTRSGIVQSVHAFGSDPVLKISFLAFIIFSMVVGYGLLIYRMPVLRSRGTLDSWVSREFAFLVNNWILLIAALFILFATLFPSLSDWVTGTRVNLATPFYTQWMAPIGLILLLLTGIGPLIAWRHATLRNLADQFAFPLTVGGITAIVLSLIPGMRVRTPVFHEQLLAPTAIINFAICAFVVGTIAQEFYRGTRVRQGHTKLDFFTSLVGLVARNKRRYGGYVIHVAIVLMFIGFAGGAYKQESEVTLERGQQASLGKYTLRFSDLRETDESDRKAVIADVKILNGPKDDLKEIGAAQPAKWYYPHHEEEPVTHVEIRSGLREDLYLVLNGFDAQAGLINLKIVINPLVNWIWMGFILLALGTVICLSPERAFQIAEEKAREAAKDAKDGGVRVATILALMIGASLMLFSSTARADDPPANMPKAHTEGQQVMAAPRTPDENELFHKLVCMCGCGRQLLADCTCGVAAKTRDELAGMLADGKTKDQVIATYMSRFPGESALAMPIDKGFNRLAWILPYAAFLLGAGGLVVAARRYGRKPKVQAAPVVVAEKDPAPGKDYEARLDDELDDLD
jgi:cytochrome c-type biogenesis protein CcmF